MPAPSGPAPGGCRDAALDHGHGGPAADDLQSEDADNTGEERGLQPELSGHTKGNRPRLEAVRDAVAERMTSQQISDVQRLARERTATARDAPRLERQVATDGFEKTLLFSKPELEHIRSVTVGQFGADQTVALVVAGDHGASFLTREGVERSFVRFDTRAATPVPLDVEGDGVYEFMDRGGGWQPVGVADAQGGSLWRHDTAFAGDAPNEMAAGMSTATGCWNS